MYLPVRVLRAGGSLGRLQSAETPVVSRPVNIALATAAVRGEEGRRGVRGDWPEGSDGREGEMCLLGQLKSNVASSHPG